MAAKPGADPSHRYVRPSTRIWPAQPRILVCSDVNLVDQPRAIDHYSQDPFRWPKTAASYSPVASHWVCCSSASKRSNTGSVLLKVPLREMRQMSRCFGRAHRSEHRQRTKPMRLRTSLKSRTTLKGRWVADAVARTDLTRTKRFLCVVPPSNAQKLRRPARATPQRPTPKA